MELKYEICNDDEWIIDLELTSDRKWIKQVLLNLLSNSLKFTFDGSIKFTCWLTKFDTIKFEVKDTGIGISE